MNGPTRQRETRGVGRMVLVALAAFGFAFALVPLYRIACEKLLGVRLEKGPASMQAGVAAAPGRTVTVLFDGGVNSKLPWGFHPNQASMQVQVGRQYATSYFANNKAARAIVGSAVPSVAPARASKYFGKTECFCFTAQTLKPGESRDMPVRFVIDPALPADIRTVTLSYTFYKNETLTAQLDAPRASADAARSAP